MKRTLIILLLLLLLTLPVSATENNDFFNAHAAECVYDGRSYTLNGSSGYVTVLDAPDGSTQDYFVNEQEMIVYGVYTDASSRLWAQLRYTPQSRGYALSDVEGSRIGWVLLSDLYHVQDKSDFLDVHEDEFVNRPLRLRLSNCPDATLWATPYAAESCGYLRWYVTDSDALLSFPAWWQDENGLRWAVWEDYFICLDEPERLQNTSASTDVVLYPAVSLSQLPQVVEQPEIVDSFSYLPYYFLTGAFVLGVLALIISVISKKSNKEGLNSYGSSPKSTRQAG